MLLGNVDFKDLKVNLAAVKDAAVSVVSEGAAPSEPVYWNYGAFIQQCIDFAILAFCVFLLVKLMNKLSTIKKKEEKAAPAPEPAPEPAPSNEEVLLAEIRDLLKEKK
jgi:large conductance mechanosensitive channel